MHSYLLNKAFYRQFFSLFFILFSIWIFGNWFSNSDYAINLYQIPYKSSRIGPRIAEQIALAAKNPKNSCIIIGPSTARDSFDPEIMNAAYPNIKFFNAGGSGGTYLVQEIQATILQRYNLQPLCIVVVINPWIMISDQPPAFHFEELIGLLTWRDILSLSLESVNVQVNEKDRRDFGLNLLLPHRRHSQQLHRLIYEMIYRFHIFIYGSRALSIDLFFNNESGKSEVLYRSKGLGNPPRFSKDLKRITESEMNSIAAAMKSRYFDVNYYGEPGYEKPLINALRILKPLTPNLFVVRTPEGSMLKIPNDYLAPHLGKQISQFPEGVRYTDLSALFKNNENKMMEDHAHPLASGRSIISLEYGRYINYILTNRTN
jgi:hypothetical protein